MTQDLMYSSICAGGAISGNDGLSRADAAVLEWRGGRKGVEQWRAKKKSPVKFWKGDGNVLEWRKSCEWKSMSRHYNDTHKCVHINSERDIDAFKPKGTHTLILTKHMMMYSLHVEFLCLKCTRVCVFMKRKTRKSFICNTQIVFGRFHLKDAFWPPSVVWDQTKCMLKKKRMHSAHLVL